MPCRSSKAPKGVLVAENDLVVRRAAGDSHLCTDGDRHGRTEVVEDPCLHPPERRSASHLSLLDEETGPEESHAADVRSYPDSVTEVTLCRLRRAYLAEFGVDIELGWTGRLGEDPPDQGINPGRVIAGRQGRPDDKGRRRQHTGFIDEVVKSLCPQVPAISSGAMLKFKPRLKGHIAPPHKSPSEFRLEPIDLVSSLAILDAKNGLQLNGAKGHREGIFHLRGHTGPHVLLLLGQGYTPRNDQPACRPDENPKHTEDALKRHQEVSHMPQRTDTPPVPFLASFDIWGNSLDGTVPIPIGLPQPGHRGESLVASAGAV